MVSTYSQLVWQIYLLGLGVACTCFFSWPPPAVWFGAETLSENKNHPSKLFHPALDVQRASPFLYPFCLLLFFTLGGFPCFAFGSLSQVRQSDSKLYIDRVSWQGYLTRFLRVVFIVNWLASSHLIQHGRRKAGTHPGVEKLFSPWWGLIQTAVMVM